MPRLGVYVADEVWQRLGMRHRDLKPSQVMQWALMVLLNPDQTPAYAGEKPAVDAEVKAEVTGPRRQQAQDAYASGYQEGFRLPAPRLTDAQIAKLRAAGGLDEEETGPCTSPCFRGRT
jgi:hypothetical protein